jgi:hypothetical protein
VGAGLLTGHGDADRDQPAADADAQSPQALVGRPGRSALSSGLPSGLSSGRPTGLPGLDVGVDVVQAALDERLDRGDRGSLGEDGSIRETDRVPGSLGCHADLSPVSHSSNTWEP